MAVSIIGGANASANQAVWCTASSPSVLVTKMFTAGVYRVTALIASAGNTPNVSLIFTGPTGIISSIDLIDFDSGSATNYTEGVITLSADASGVLIATTATVNVGIEKVADAVNSGATMVLNTYTTSQSITIDNSFFAALAIGGGGNGGTGWTGGGGGGSGYLASTYSIAPGTYPLIVGGGGGGTTTFAGMTAAGGNNASGGNGGNGGSGGGGSQYSNGGVGGTGGSNGSAGQAASAVAGTGSGITKPGWLTITSVGGTSSEAGGFGGGFYGGGGGAGGRYGGTGGSAAAGTGGGGGGGGQGDSAPGAGGAGALYILRTA